MNRVIIMKKWIDQAKETCNDAQMKEICHGLLMYGLYGEEYVSQDVTVNTVLNLITPQIDSMQESYEKRVENGKKGGRPCKIDSNRVYMLAQEGKTGKEIAEILGANIKSVYNCRGWLNRKDRNFMENS